MDSCKTKPMISNCPSSNYIVKQFVSREREEFLALFLEKRERERKKRGKRNYIVKRFGSLSLKYLLNRIFPKKKTLILFQRELEEHFMVLLSKLKRTLCTEHLWLSKIWIKRVQHPFQFFCFFNLSLLLLFFIRSSSTLFIN